VAVVTKPFPFEGNKRMQVAERGIAELGQHVDSLITIPNEKLLQVLGKGTTLLEAFKCANDVLFNAVQGIAELITRPGLINVDFADVRTVMSEMGVAMMGSGRATGENRAREAAEQAIHSPLLEDINLSGAKGILVNITAGLDMSIGEFDEVGNTVKEFACEDATVVVGTVIDPEMHDDLRVTVVATGLGELRPMRQAPEEPKVKPVRLVNSDIVAPGVVDYRDMDIPTVTRKSPKREKSYLSSTKEGDMDYLDIPAFLRRQAD
jgi:cell division protein FtsZ